MGRTLDAPSHITDGQGERRPRATPVAHGPRAGPPPWAWPTYWTVHSGAWPMTVTDTVTASAASGSQHPTGTRTEESAATVTSSTRSASMEPSASLDTSLTDNPSPTATGERQGPLAPEQASESKHHLSIPTIIAIILPLAALLTILTALVIMRRRRYRRKRGTHERRASLEAEVSAKEDSGPLAAGPLHDPASASHASRLSSSSVTPSSSSLAGASFSASVKAVSTAAQDGGSSITPQESPAVALRPTEKPRRSVPVLTPPPVAQTSPQFPPRTASPFPSVIQTQVPAPGSSATADARGDHVLVVPWSVGQRMLAMVTDGNRTTMNALAEEEPIVDPPPAYAPRAARPP